jgi:hypothetical protein
MAYTVWEVADAARVPGTTTTVQLHPQQLSTALKARVVKTLRTGIAFGGHRAYGVIIARKLAHKFSLPLVSGWDSQAVHVRDDTPESIRQGLAELIKADASSEILAPTHDASYYIENVKRATSSHLKGLANPCEAAYRRGNDSFTLTFYNSGLRNKARKLAEIAVSAEYLAKAEEIIALLDKEDPITIETF